MLGRFFARRVPRAAGCTHLSMKLRRRAPSRMSRANRTQPKSSATRRVSNPVQGEARTCEWQRPVWGLLVWGSSLMWHTNGHAAAAQVEGPTEAEACHTAPQPHGVHHLVVGSERLPRIDSQHSAGLCIGDTRWACHSSGGPVVAPCRRATTPICSSCLERVRLCREDRSPGAGAHHWEPRRWLHTGHLTRRLLGDHAGGADHRVHAGVRHERKGLCSLPRSWLLVRGRTASSQHGERPFDGGQTSATSSGYTLPGCSGHLEPQRTGVWPQRRVCCGSAACRKRRNEQHALSRLGLGVLGPASFAGS